jgi:site-specific recombinase XerD
MTKNNKAAKVQSMYRKALKTPRVSLGASHTLYPMERETSLRHIRAALGHNSFKATEIYTRVLSINNKKTKIILDIIQKSVNLVCNMK